MKKHLLIIAFIITGLYSSTTSLVAQVTANQPPDYHICDLDNDGIAVFDLTLQDAQIINGQDPVNLFVTYYESLEAAQTGVNPIVDPTLFINTINPQVIYARLEDSTNGDYDITNFFIKAEVSPAVNTPTPLEVFDENSDGIEVFDLTTKIPEILNGQTNVDVAFYETQLNADAGLNAIGNPGAFLNTTNPQTIWVRLEDFDTGCYAITELLLVANPNLGVNNNLLNNLQLYPNPSTGIINVQSNNLTETVAIAVYNIQGQELISENKTSENGTISFDVSNLPTGVYFIEIVLEDVSVIKRIVKQ